MKNTFTFIILFSLQCLLVLGQEKKPLSFDEMLNWNSMKSAKLSNDGNWVVYETAPTRGDGQTVLLQVKTGKEKIFPLGKGATLSPESDFMIIKKGTAYDSIRQAKINKVPKNKMPQDSVQLYHFKQGQLYSFHKVKKFSTPRKQGDIGVLLIDKKAFIPKKKPAKKQEQVKQEKQEQVKEEQEKKAASEEEQQGEAGEEQGEEQEEEEQQGEEQQEKSDQTPQNPQKKEAVKTPQAPKAKPMGDVLVVYNGTFNDTTRFEGVTEYKLSGENGMLTFITQFQDSVLRSSVYALAPDDTIPHQIFQGEGIARKITIDRTGEQVAFLYSDDSTKEVKNFHVWLGSTTGEAQEVVTRNSAGMPAGFAPSVRGDLIFSYSGKRLFLATAPLAEKKAKDSIPADEIPTLDLWSWTDKQLQPQQLRMAQSYVNRTFDGIYHIDSKRYIQLADSICDKIMYTPYRDEEFAMTKDPNPYFKASSWLGKYDADWYAINLNTGEKQLLVSGVQYFNYSPNGNYAVWYNETDSMFYGYDIKQQKRYTISDKIEFPLYNEDFDMPMVPQPYGIVGWGKEGNSVILKDRYDLWQCSFGQQMEVSCITQGYGRKNKISLDYKNTDPEQFYFLSNKDLILYGQQEESNDMSIFRFNSGKKKALTVVESGPYIYGNPIVSLRSQALLFSKQNFQTYPDYYLTDKNFKSPRKITHINPQQTDYLWGEVEQVSWLSLDGEKLKGLLYKPENFDPQKKYPMLVYFYEKNFNNQHRHYRPGPSRSVINTTFYVSNGYLVFIPDIVYKTGQPGMDAYNAIVGGVNQLLNQYKWIDPNAIGLQGQSWGGYQTAILITKTDLFAAAMGGAVVSNMTSAYGGMRWGNGITRISQYEKGQSRIGATLWQDLPAYIENSPLFHADNINTPLLLMHNDGDDAVPWYQGIELFNALRRLDKPVWMINYNKETHNLRATSIANQIDLSKRMKQFFDHYLKGAPAPRWLTEGIPAIQKRKDLGYE